MQPLTCFYCQSIDCGQLPHHNDAMPNPSAIFDCYNPFNQHTSKLKDSIELDIMFQQIFNCWQFHFTFPVFLNEFGVVFPEFIFILAGHEWNGEFGDIIIDGEFFIIFKFFT